MTTEVEQTEFTFDKLTDKAKQYAREQYTDVGYLSDDWWDCVYEDAVEVAKLLGIEINSDTYKSRNGRVFNETSIYFSGFCSQGDGASFSGRYECMPDAVRDITAHAPQDETLLDIAKDLTLSQVTARMLFGKTLQVSITTSGRYSHSGNMVFGWYEVESLEFNEDDVDLTEIQNDIEGCLRRFASWIYKQLETQHDWLYSDECVDQYLEGEIFDEDGNVI